MPRTGLEKRHYAANVCYKVAIMCLFIVIFYTETVQFGIHVKRRKHIHVHIASRLI